jgi:hypothetical protein
MAKDRLRVYSPIEAINAATAVNAKWNVLTSQETTSSSGTYNIDVSAYNQLLVVNKGFGIAFSFRNDISNTLQGHNTMYTNASSSNSSAGIVPLSIPTTTKYFSFKHNGSSAGNTKVWVVGY